MTARRSRDQLLDRERRPASPGLAGAAENDDELVLPITERALPAPEPRADPPEEVIVGRRTVGPAVAARPVQTYGQDRKPPAVGELPPQDPKERRAVRQPRELVQPARSLVCVLQGRSHRFGEQPEGALLLGAETPSAEDHGPAPLALSRAYGHRHEALYAVNRLLAAHDLPLAAAPEHEALDRGVPPAGAGVEISLQHGSMPGPVQRGNVRVGAPANRVRRLGRPLKDSLDVKHSERRPEHRDQALRP